MALSLVLGPLQAPGSVVFRSGFRWLVEDGRRCARDEVIAYCNIRLQLSGARQLRPADFEDDSELQVGLAAPMGGRIRRLEGAAPGGYLNIMQSQTWDPDFPIATLEPDGEAAGDQRAPLRQIVLAGRRMTQLADVHAGLLPGWLARSRAWWGRTDERPVRVVSLGICDAAAVVLGDDGAFLDLFAKIPRAAHVVFYPDHPVTPAAPVLLDQLTRTPADVDAIAADLRRAMAGSSLVPTPSDWMFVGALLAVIGHSPILETDSVILGSGLVKLGPAQAVIMSLNAEPLGILRHRALGYHLYIMPHHLLAAGPAVRSWLGSEFEVVKRSIADIRRDYETLIDKVSARTGARLVVINRMSSSGREDVSNYAPFDAPLSATLANVESKALNLMLHDIAEDRDLFILDADAAAAELGGAQHVPDGVHYSGALQSRLQSELAAIIEAIREGD